MPYALHFFVIILTAVICEVIYQRIRYNINQKRRSNLMKKKNYCYSFDDEHYELIDNAKTESEAEEYTRNAMKNAGYNKAWLGICVPISIDEVIPFGVAEDIDMALRINEYARDNFGECADDYLVGLPEKVFDDLEKSIDSALNKVVKEWIIKNHLEPTFFNVENPKMLSLHQD